jgi:putative oxidoreductase
MPISNHYRALVLSQPSVKEITMVANTALHQAAGLVLRSALGVVFLAHSVYLKGVVFGLPGTAQFFVSLGLPEVLAYVVFAAEALGGLALIAGIQVRWAALLLVPIALGATWAHAEAGWLFTNDGGGWEYPLFLTAALIVQSLIGDGALALSRSVPLHALHPAMRRATRPIGSRRAVHAD